VDSLAGCLSSGENGVDYGLKESMSMKNPKRSLKEERNKKTDY